MTSNVNLTEPPELIKKGLVICRESHTYHTFGIFYGQNPLDFSFPLFLLQISTLLLITRVVRFLLKPLRQPNVVSEILGSIILGPSVLSRNDKLHAYIFPPEYNYVIKNVGLLGLIYFVFVSSVKMDVMEFKRSDRKSWYIAIFGMFVPLFCSVTVGMLQKNSLNAGLGSFSAIWGISMNLSIAAFPVVYPIVKELNLLSSGIGRMALKTTMISDLIGFHVLIVFEMLVQGQRKPIFSLWFFLSFIGVTVACLSGAKQAMDWIIRSTPEEKPVDEAYVTAVLVAVIAAAFVTDTFGMSVANGPMWMGLVVPTGPPLGTALVKKMETIVTNILMPFIFMYIGLVFDFSSVFGQWSHMRPLMLMLIIAYTMKILSTFIASRFNHMTIRDSLTLSLLLGLKGQVDFLMLVRLNDLKILDTPHFTAMALSATTMTALVTPLISILYDPRRPYLLDKRRNIQHSLPNAQLHILACIHSQENLSGLIRLIQLTNPTPLTPLSVDALCLEDLIGSNPVLIDHQAEGEEETPDKSNVHSALNTFQDAVGDDCLTIHSYTTITSRTSMYQDICQMALANNASLVVLPSSSTDNNHSLNTEVLVHAPCSVAIIMDKSPHQTLVHGALRSPMQQLAMLFLGGADAREALAYADRMVGNPDVCLTVVRFLPGNTSEGDNDMEKKLDDGLVTQFWLKCEGKERISYREVVVNNGEETIGAIQAMDKQVYDLWIVGRKHGINPVLLSGLSGWSEENELGVIGEYVASADFNSTASVLAVQQQILRGQQKVSATTFFKTFPFSTSACR